MKITKLMGAGVLMAATAFATGTLPAQAKTHHPMSINARQQRQHRRIESGERKGQLTNREQNRLQQRERLIRLQEQRDRRDGGKFTTAERLRIQRELNHTSHSVYHQKHDTQGRR